MSVLPLVWTLGCARTPMGPPVAAATTADLAFKAQAEQIFEDGLAARPDWAVSLGLHEHDGLLPEVSASALARDLERLRAARRVLESFSPEKLDETHQLEREALLVEIRSELFTLEESRSPWRDPIWYDDRLDLDDYISRDYAPLETRARAVVKLARSVPAYLSDARANLEPSLAAPWLEIARFEIEGHLEFVRGDVRKAFEGLVDPGLRRELGDALDVMAAELERHRAFLIERAGHADQSHVLGKERLSRMVLATQGLDMGIDEIEAIGQADLEHDLAALTDSAKAIDPDRSVAEVVAEVTAQKPADLLAEARVQAEELRRFLVDHDVVSVPAGGIAEVRETPPFARTAAAYLNASGIFEKAQVPTFYSITPPDPDWTPEEQREYVPSLPDLLITTAHELWPGHFLDELHRHRLTSRILATSWTTVVGEGWAHYGEALVWDQGLRGGDPRIHVAQLQEALIRDVRVLCSIGLHARGWTIDDCAARFRDDAFQGSASAMQEAMRGTNDPMYLGYTLGKHLITALREEVQAREGTAFSLRAFHDRFLSCGGAPFPAIRRAMLSEANR